VWQSLHASLQDRKFTVVTVAMDEPEAARPWIEQARPTFPCLIDRNHHVADLYNMVNVPQASWIDEAGRIVRPPENAGSSDAFRHMDRVTLQMSTAQMAQRNRTKQTYVAAVRDWVAKGAASEFAYDAASVRSKLRLPDAAAAQAHAHFRLAQALLRKGNGAGSTALRGGQPTASGVLDHLASGGKKGCNGSRRQCGVLGPRRCARGTSLSSPHRYARHCGRGCLAITATAGKARRCVSTYPAGRRTEAWRIAAAARIVCLGSGRDQQEPSPRRAPRWRPAG